MSINTSPKEDIIWNEERMNKVATILKALDDEPAFVCQTILNKVSEYISNQSVWSFEICLKKGIQL